MTLFIYIPFNLKLTNGSNTVELTDNSKVQATQIFNDAGRVYQIISGSDGSPYDGNGYAQNSASYGLFLPDIGTLMLNTSALTASAAEGGIAMTVDNGSNLNGANPKFMFDALRAGAHFTMRSQETLSSDYVFVRARNAEFNYTENPSFISGSTGEVIYSNFIESPETYITTVGLYNDANELLAVAKLSKPLNKDFTKELLVRVKLDF